MRTFIHSLCLASTLLVSLPIHAQLTDHPFASPVPVEWVGLPRTDGLSLRFQPFIGVGDWPVDLVRGDYWAAGVPVNPAEHLFYLSDHIPPFLLLQVSGHAGPFGLHIEIPVQKEYLSRATYPSTNYLSDSLAGAFDITHYSFDMTFPHTAYLYYASEPFYFAAGRFPLKWGRARYPLTISPSTYQDNLTASWQGGAFRYTFHVISSSPLLGNSEEDIQTHCYDYLSEGRIFSDPYKTIAAHRLDLLGPLWRVGVGEINIIGGKAPDLLDVSPLMYYHNTYGEGYSNVVFALDGDLTLWDSLTIYGEASFDDADVPLTEAGVDYKPGAYGFNFGLEWNQPGWQVWAEYDYTSEWMYVTSYLPYLHVNVRHFYIDNYTSPSRILVDYPLGFTYGPDAQMASVGGSFNGTEIACGLVYNVLIKGTVKDGDEVRWKWFWDGWPESVRSADTTKVDPSALPPGPGQVYHILTLQASWREFSLWGRMVAGAEWRWFAGISWKRVWSK
ncbi:hypothetical protein Spith_1628 [Spirochaeta thermophila DSM 6578]|uniref:Uncharacterized protein n=1 Tax=Winmispira thermophila (strain ATCC 700085 / DSM 6578 / Z-1203) TaxID=869211 RepID=G0GB80_WINT7|nr:hypothetical protein [Spirochaeta thermophila]AEJ61889.1 hypothetical protein Spith_1628 [Spirochaeta thermophila DSM 6578]